MIRRNGMCDLKNIASVDTDKYGKMEELLGALSNKTRLAILSVILEHESVCACELQSALGLGQPTVSSNLQRLYTAGISEKRNGWRYTFHSVREEYRDFLKGIMRQPVKSSSITDENLITSR
jgi:ArsR family transcriptional regulator